MTLQIKRWIQYIINMKISKYDANKCHGGRRDWIVWTDAHGRQHILSNMQTGHIQNCIIRISETISKCAQMNLGEFYLNGRNGSDWIAIFRNELKYRGVIIY